MTGSRDYPLGKELTNTLREISSHYCEKEGGSHGPDHSDRVYSMALAMGQKMNARLDILAAAALLHDIGRRYETESKGGICHASKSAEMAIEILTELNFTPEIIEFGLLDYVLGRTLQNLYELFLNNWNRKVIICTKF